MFYVFSTQGRMFTGTLEQLRRTLPVTRSSRVRPAESLATGLDEPVGLPEAGTGRPFIEQQARAAYGALDHPHTRHPLTRASDVMHTPAHTLSADTRVDEAWHLLAQWNVGQAPVVDTRGVLVGLAGRAELLPSPRLDRELLHPDRWQALLARPVSQLMWSPVTGTAPDTHLRRVAAAMVNTGLPGLPVVSEAGQVIGFVSRSDLLRALVADPPLDLWG